MDSIQLDSTKFGALLGGDTTGVDDGELYASAGGLAHDSNDFLLYDTATGALYYDADGNGTAAARVQFAVITGLTGAVDSTDFFL